MTRIAYDEYVEHLRGLLGRDLLEIPDDVGSEMDDPHVTLTPLDRVDDLLAEGPIRREAGIGEFSDGNHLVAMRGTLPGVTREMIAWWYWWYPQDKLRYQAWDKGAHVDVAFSPKDDDYFNQLSQPSFAGSLQDLTVMVGARQETLRTRLVGPREFGFSAQALEAAGDPYVACGSAGSLGGRIDHTRFAHVFFPSEGGLEVESRFWVGQGVTNGLIRRRIVSQARSRALAELTCSEWLELARILPDLHASYGGGIS